MGPMWGRTASIEPLYLGRSRAFIKEINCGHQEDSEVLGKSGLWTCQK